MISSSVFIVYRALLYLFFKYYFYTIYSDYTFPFPPLLSGPPYLPIHTTPCLPFLSFFKKANKKKIKKHTLKKLYKNTKKKK